MSPSAQWPARPWRRASGSFSCGGTRQALRSPSQVQERRSAWPAATEPQDSCCFTWAGGFSEQVSMRRCRCGTGNSRSGEDRGQVSKGGWQRPLCPVQQRRWVPRGHMQRTHGDAHTAGNWDPAVWLEGRQGRDETGAALEGQSPFSLALAQGQRQTARSSC